MKQYGSFILAAVFVFLLCLVSCSLKNGEPESTFSEAGNESISVDSTVANDQVNNVSEEAVAEKAAAEKAAADKAAAEKAVAEKAAAEKAAAEKAAAEKAAAEKAAAEKAAAEKAAAEKAAADKAAADKAAAEKAAAEEAAKYKITLIDFIDVFYKNTNVTIKMKGKPLTEYILAVKYKSGWSKASGLGSKMTDTEGYASWTFKVGGNTSEDYTPYIQITGNNDELKKEFTVAG